MLIFAVNTIKQIGQFGHRTHPQRRATTYSRSSITEAGVRILKGPDPLDKMDDREKLRQEFQNQPAEAQTGKWDAMWQQKVTPWDRSEPNPALIDALNEKSDILGSPHHQDGARKKALIPGCGRGYDVLLLASHGYDAYGVDVSQTAIDACNALEQEQGRDDSKYPVKDAKIGRGTTDFLLADFFNDDLSSRTGGGRFDVIYDYTFLCAIPPELRPKWSKRMSELLVPGGSLICLEFPLAKSPKAGGPPHGLSSELYVQLFKQPGKEVNYGEDGYVAPDDREQDSQKALSRVAHWQPTRTHQVGKGIDMVSVWKHV